jgi:Putative zinc-finger
MTTQQRDEGPLPPGWGRCPPGEVSRLGRRLRGRRRRRLFLRAAVTTAAGVFVTGGVLGLWRAFSRPGEYDYGGITCAEVVRLLDDYAAKKLPPADQDRVREHLARCPKCRPLSDRIRSPA